MFVGDRTMASAWLTSTVAVGAISIGSPKGISLRENTSYGAQIVKISQIGAEILRFFSRWLMAAILDLWELSSTFWIDSQIALHDLFSLCKIWIAAVVLIVQKFVYFMQLAWKRLATSKMDDLQAYMTHKMGYGINMTPKRHTLAFKNVIWRINCQTLSNDYWYIAICHFFKMAAVGHLGFVEHISYQLTKTTFWSFKCTELWIFCTFRLKTPSHAPKMFFGAFD